MLILQFVKKRFDFFKKIQNGENSTKIPQKLTCCFVIQILFQSVSVTENNDTEITYTASLLSLCIVQVMYVSV